MIAPHDWDEQGARILAFDEELTLVEVFCPIIGDEVIAQVTNSVNGHRPDL